ncbi:MAG: hypothetical protein ABFD84_09970 [Candidatus Polarisedimenticolia bacterium]
MTEPGYAKRSAQIAWLADAEGERLIAGWEEGGDEPSGAPSPSPWPPRRPPLALPAGGGAGEARRWRAAFLAATGLPGAEVAVRRGAALVEERSGATAATRRIESAQLLLGGSPDAPRLARTLLVERGAAPPPAVLDDTSGDGRGRITSRGGELGQITCRSGELPSATVLDGESAENEAATGAVPPRAALDAARRETAGWDDALPTIDVAELCRAGRPLVLDLFAWADLVRAAAFFWEAGRRTPGTVAALAFDAADPGLPFPLETDGGDADEGRREAPRVLVRAGRLVPSAPALSRPSWRSPAVPGLRALETGVRLRADWPPDAAAVTAALILPGATLLRGVALEDGRPAARFPWTAAAAPNEWPRRVVAALGEPLWDLTGLPTRASAVLVDGRRGVLGS